MKHKANFRLILTSVAFMMALLFLEAKRIQNRRASSKAQRNVSRDDNNFNVSNTDYIFFESLSKYLFISVEK